MADQWLPVGLSAAERREFLERQPTYWLKRAYQALRRRVDGELRPLGLTLSQREALLALNHLGPASQGSLASSLGLEQSSVSRLVDGLARRALVTVREDNRDRRSTIISLTDEGAWMLERTPGASGIAGHLLAQRLSEEEIHQLVDLLRRCTMAWEEIAPERHRSSKLSVQTGEA